MVAYAPQSQGPFLKGLVASNSPLAQPKGSFPRGSNLVMMERGALTPCDGSAIINWFNGALQSASGRFMAMTLYEPTGVNPYYVALKKEFTPTVPVQGISLVAVGSGSLPAGTYYYKITAIDGVGGESLPSLEASITIPAGDNIALVWNIVPNAFGYNIYRSTSSGNEVLMVGPGLPIIQPNPITPTVAFTDSIVSPSPTYSLSFWQRSSVGSNLAIYFITTIPNNIQANQSAIVSGTGIDGTYAITQKRGNELIHTGIGSATPLSGTSGTIQGGGTPPPSVDTMQQTLLYVMPSGAIPVPYNTNNVQGLFPASLEALGQVPTGGSGGGGTSGPGINGQGASTPSGGIQGLVGPLPQFKQFTNRLIFALGNGFAPQIFSDATGTTVNPLFSGTVASVVKSGDQVTVTVDGGTTLTASNMPVGSNAILALTDASYAGVFVVLAVSTGAGGNFTVRIPTATGLPATGAFSVPVQPLVSTFTPAYPTWTASTAYAVGDIIVPITQTTPAIYLTATQAGTSGASEPTWNATIGNQISDGGGTVAAVIWTVTATLNSSAPPPPGAGHIEIYSGSLWAFNTSPTNTANGLEGPCALRQSNPNDPFGWNPIYQAFLDKDDGAEGMGMGKFTITAQGIPPEGSLIAFKYRVPYQIIGVFGANNFAIQPVSSDMGCLAPRSIQFVPGYGLMRYTHLGIGVFNGYKDEVVSEQVRPYLFPVNDFDASDIVVADANFIPLSWAAQTANPPMYTFAMPVGNSGGQLTQMMLYDLVLKCWAGTVALPFAIGCMAQVQPVTSNPLTILGGFSDGCLQRWQAGDVQWYTGAPSPINVAWSMRTITVASQNSSQRLWARKVILRGTNSGVAGTIAVQVRSSAVPQSTLKHTIPATGDFDVFSAIGITGIRFDAIISGIAHVEIEGIDWAIEPRPFGVPVHAI